MAEVDQSGGWESGYQPPIYFPPGADELITEGIIDTTGWYYDPATGQYVNSPPGYQYLQSDYPANQDTEWIVWAGIVGIAFLGGIILLMKNLSE